jgi:hypothetical protein
MSLANRYAQLATDREVYLSRARDSSKLTIPTLFPPDGANSATNYPTPWQSHGARCVNNLAAKLLLALFPPNAPFFKLALDDYAIEKMTEQKGMRADVEKALNKIERAVVTELESTTSRPALFEGLKQLIVGGNALLVVDEANKVRIFKLHQYVTKRDPAGNPLEIVIKETISAMELPEELRAKYAKVATPDNPQAKDEIDLYTSYKLVRQGTLVKWLVWQEINGERIPGAGEYPHDRCPARPLRWTALDGEDYGRGMVEEYLGDMKSLEGLQKALVQAAAAASKVLFLVRPNSTTNRDALTKSESGEVHAGNKEDVTVVQMEKYNDFRTALETRNDLITSLSYAFMLNTAIQRQGERVTAEEIRFMAQELESGLGGVYSTMSQDLQLPLVSILMANMERQSRLPVLPKGVVKPTITTGIEAIGRGNDVARLTEFVQTISMLGPEVVAQYLNVSDFIKRVAVSKQIDAEGLIKSEEQMAQEQQQAQMMAMAERAAPNAVNKLGDAMLAGQQQGAA